MRNRNDGAGILKSTVLRNNFGFDIVCRVGLRCSTREMEQKLQDKKWWTLFFQFGYTINIIIGKSW